MTNQIEKLDAWEVRDLEDERTYKIEVEKCSELGNKSQPGLRIKYFIGGSMYYCVYEPHIGEKLAYDAKKSGGSLVRADKSWLKHDDLWLRNSLVVDGDKLKARVEVKVRSKDEPVMKEYELPFSF
ncbi:MAG: hypothetical protein KDB68_00445 [Planctomycetes bacterium]|nr:hypothetical protein [Planctomycetota bacterium]MCA8934648.1 hypothetical protein [Planctomycetota bacterium]